VLHPADTSPPVAGELARADCESPRRVFSPDAHARGVCGRKQDVT
jgi:hypothetical protein